MKKYPKYKPSGVEWIGEVPEHWEVKKLKRFLTVKSGDFHPPENDLDEGYPIYGGNGFRGYSKEFNFEGEALLIGRVGAKCGNVHLVNGQFWISEHALRVLSKKAFNNKLFKYLLEIVDFNQFAIRTAQPLINTTIVEEQIIAVSDSIPEQTAIAAYLDRKTAQIDQTIAEKEKLIELFREERQAIINHAVTKGIRPGVKMKNSGVEWIGEVPEGWEVKRVKHVCLLQGRIGFKGYSKTDLVNEGEGALTLGAKHINKMNELDLSVPEFLSWEKYYESPEIMVQKGHVIVTQRGSLGKVAVIDKDIGAATINPSIILLKEFSIDQRFFYYSLNGRFFVSWIEMVNNATAVPMISQEMLANLPIVCPYLAEQKEIVAYLDQKTTQIDDAISGIQQEIALLQEYRQALIFEAVTGKIDVREYAQN